MTRHRPAAAEIAADNDTFRRRLGFTRSVPGRVLMTRGVALLPDSERFDILDGVRTFNRFTADNDPHGEHDFGRFDSNGSVVLWKIDYYADARCEWGAEDPRTSYRVLTIMLAEEY